VNTICIDQRRSKSRWFPAVLWCQKVVLCCQDCGADAAAQWVQRQTTAFRGRVRGTLNPNRKPADQISSEVALNTYRNTEQIAELLEKLNALTVEVHQHIYHCEE
jgi:hypothetical protein